MRGLAFAASLSWHTYFSSTQFRRPLTANKGCAGAHDVDKHFREAPFKDNIPVLLGLTGVWNTTFLGYSSLAILPYTQALSKLAPHIQQARLCRQCPSRPRCVKCLNLIAALTLSHVQLRAAVGLGKRSRGVILTVGHAGKHVCAPVGTATTLCMPCRPGCHEVTTFPILDVKDCRVKDQNKAPAPVAHTSYTACCW